VSRILRFIPLICFTLIATLAFSQSSTPNSGDIFEEISDVPIDGAIAILTVAGIGLGVKKLYNRKK
jgi:hypothetical protein